MTSGLSKIRLVERMLPDAEDGLHERFITTAIERGLEIKRKNEGVIATQVQFDWMTDGVPDKPIESVEPGGRVSFFYNPMAAVVNHAMKLLRELSPVGPSEDGHYSDAFKVLVADTENAWHEINWPSTVHAIHVNIANTKPYSGSLEPHTRSERGPRTSRQAPNGITELVVEILRMHWGRVMKIDLKSLQWESLMEGKNPYYHIPTISIHPRWRSIQKAL